MANFRIPNSQGQTRTIYQTDKYGELWDTFGIDLQSIGKIKSAKKMLKVKDVGDDTNFGDAVALATYGTHNYVITSGTDKEMYRCDVVNDVTVEANWVKINTNGVFVHNTDATVFGGELLVSQATDIMSYDGSSDDPDWWTSDTPCTEDSCDANGASLSSFFPHVLKVQRSQQETLFVTDGNLVRYYNATAGHSTVTLQEDTVACCLSSGPNSMFVGTFTETNEKALVYEIFIGEVLDSTPVARNSYPIDGRAVLAIEVIDGIPYVITDKGHIQRFNGAGFVTVNSLPFAFTDETLAGVRAGTVNKNSQLRPIHHGGSDVHNQSFYFALNTERYNTDKTPNRCSTGIWEYNTVTNQLNHRSAFVETAAQNGGHLGAKSGPLMVIDNSESLFLAGFELNGESNGLFAESTSRFGHIITREIETASVTESFKSLYLKIKTIVNDDTVDIKYRTNDRDRQCITGTWISTHTFNTTETLTVEIGDELTLIDGTGAGSISHVTGVDNSLTVTSVTLADAIGVIGEVDVAEVTTFHKIPVDYTDEDKEFKKTGSDQVGTWIQFKLVFNGEIVLREFISSGTVNTEL